MEAVLDLAEQRQPELEEMVQIEEQIKAISEDPERVGELRELRKRRNTLYHIIYRAKNPSKVRQARVRRYHINKEKDNIWRQNGLNRLRNDIFNHYGNQCSRCGETDSALFILMYTGDGADPHKTNNGGSTRRYRNIRKAGFPEGYATFCYNCNIRLRKQGRVSVAEKERQAKEEQARIDTFSRIVAPFEDS